MHLSINKRGATKRNSLVGITCVLLICMTIFTLSSCAEEDGEISTTGLGSGITEIIMYETLLTNYGDMGGRIGADTFCKNDGSAPLGMKNYHAFLSTGETETSGIHQLKDFPTFFKFPATIPIKAKNGEVIASNWPDLFDGIPKALTAPEFVLNFSGIRYWTGSDGTGDVDLSVNCSGFTSYSNAVYGLLGEPDNSDDTWISDTPTDCSFSLPVHCIAY